MPVNPYERYPYSDVPELPPPPPGMGKRKHRGVIIALVLLVIMLLDEVGAYVIHARTGQQVSHAQSKQVMKMVPAPTLTVPVKVVTGKEVLHDFQINGLMVAGSAQESTMGLAHQPVDGMWGFNTAMGAGDYLQLATLLAARMR